MLVTGGGARTTRASDDHTKGPLTYLVRVGRARARRRPFADVMNRTYWLHVLLTDCAVRPCRVSVDSTPTQLSASTGLDETSGREAELLKRSSDLEPKFTQFEIRWRKLVAQIRKKLP